VAGKLAFLCAQNVNIFAKCHIFHIAASLSAPFISVPLHPPITEIPCPSTRCPSPFWGPMERFVYDNIDFSGGCQRVPVKVERGLGSWLLVVGGDWAGLWGVVGETPLVAATKVGNSSLLTSPWLHSGAASQPTPNRRSRIDLESVRRFSILWFMWRSAVLLKTAF